MSKVYEYVTQRILAQLDAGTVPWRKPWTGGAASNFITGKPYRGINTMLLPHGGEYATPKQILAAKGSIKKGSKISIIVFYLPPKHTNKRVVDPDAEEEYQNMVFQYWKVFSIADTDLVSKIPLPERQHTPIAEAQAIVDNWKDKPVIQHYHQGAAFYSPWKDTITMPLESQFFSPAEYYSTLFHEMHHATGLQKRLGRFNNDASDRFGSHSYSKEELVAEMGAAMLCAQCGLDGATIENSVAYIDGWRKRISTDLQLVVRAASQAQKSCDLILGAAQDTSVEAAA